MEIKKNWTVEDIGHPLYCDNFCTFKDKTEEETKAICEEWNETGKEDNENWIYYEEMSHEELSRLAEKWL